MAKIKIPLRLKITGWLILWGIVLVVVVRTAISLWIIATQGQIPMLVTGGAIFSLWALVMFGISALKYVSGAYYED